MRTNNACAYRIEVLVKKKKNEKTFFTEKRLRNQMCCSKRQQDNFRKYTFLENIIDQGKRSFAFSSCLFTTLHTVSFEISF